MNVELERELRQLEDSVRDLGVAVRDVELRIGRLNRLLEHDPAWATFVPRPRKRSTSSADGSETSRPG